ncbi:MAG: hypothetical protein ACERKN_05495 [Velocimicrobium sp.]
MTLFLLVVAFGLLIVFPNTAFDGAKSGLLLWFQVILPTLFPFLVITNMMERLLPISSGKLYTLFTGFLSGYPIGAKSCNFVVKEGKLSKKEGQFYLSFCNNASPAFLLNYVFIHCLNVSNKRFLLLGILYLSAILSALFIYPKNKPLRLQSIDSTPVIDQKKFTNKTLSFDTVIMASFEIITKIGGYIILFSLIANIIRMHLPLPGFIKIIVCGTLEITTGVNLIYKSVLSPSIKLLITMFIASFGGISALFQTQAVIKDSSLSIRTYINLKLVGSGICVCITYLLLLFNII